MERPAIEPGHLGILRDILGRFLPAQSQVWVYGSRARGGRLKRGSDPDLAIDAGVPLACVVAADLREALDESDLPYKVDLLDLRTAQEDFKRLIAPDMVLLPFGGGG